MIFKFIYNNWYWHKNSAKKTLKQAEHCVWKNNNMSPMQQLCCPMTRHIFTCVGQSISKTSDTGLRTTLVSYMNALCNVLWLCTGMVCCRRIWYEVHTNSQKTTLQWLWTLISIARCQRLFLDQNWIFSMIGTKFGFNRMGQQPTLLNMTWGFWGRCSLVFELIIRWHHLARPLTWFNQCNFILWGYLKSKVNYPRSDLIFKT